ncbi:MAG: agmatine deiminase family protein, partial [Sedimentisphaerales bacterium]|nr:agmatine deiminase family protein [Sedimentisphaerales bacterium]
MKRSLTEKTIVNFLILCAAVVFALSVHAQAASIPPDVLEAIAANYPDGLPRYITPEEKQWLAEHPEIASAQTMDIGQEITAAPSGTVWTPGEYEELDGVIIAWEAQTDVLTDFAVEVSQSDTNAKVYVVVDSSYEQSTVTSTLTSAGANMSNVVFLVRATDTVWICDYGPRYNYEDGSPAIIDHTYNRPRTNDNALPAWISTSSEPFSQSEPVYEMDLTHGGGNFLAFSNGDAFMSSLVLEENSGKTQSEIETIIEDHFNVDSTIYTKLSSSVDLTGHIDMWFMPLGDNKVLISQFSTNTYGEQTSTNNAAADMASRGYTVYRTPAWYSGGTHYTYTNAAIVNNKVFVPQFSGYSSNNATALSVYQTAMPDHEIIPLDCSSIITSAGAIHCVMKHVYAENTSPPDPASDPDPTNGATDISINADVSWTAGAGATSHDVYFGTDSTPDSGEFIGNQSGTTYDPGTLSYNTTYYWRIDEKNANGTTTGTVWSFTTIPPDTTPPSPDPLTWASVPAATGSSTIIMTATTATDISGVEYSFECTTDGSASSGWQSSATYEASGLTPSTLYTFRVKARDLSTNYNETGWSGTASATTEAPATDIEILGDWATGLTHAKEAGSDRALIFIANCELSAAVSLTATYGGQPMTKVIDVVTGTSGYRNYVAAFILDEAGIVAATNGTFVPSWSPTPTSVSYSSIFLQNVDQTNIIGATDSAVVTTGTTVATDPLNTNDGDMVILGTVSGNNGSYTLNNGFTEGTDQSVGSSGHTSASGHKAATGADETPSATHSTSYRQAIIGLVVQAVSGPAMVDVPNVVGMTEVAANSAITGVGLTVGSTTYACSNTVPAGNVISSDPTGGTSVPVGSSVDLVVSTGQPSVPDVTGMTEASAIAAINAVADISYGSSSTACSNTVPAGDVISQ